LIVDTTNGCLSLRKVEAIDDVRRLLYVWVGYTNSLTYGNSKEYSLHKRHGNFSHTSTSNRHNEVPRTKNGEDRILDERYNADTQ